MTFEQLKEFRTSLEAMLKDSTESMTRIGKKLRRSIASPDVMDKRYLESERDMLISRAGLENQLIRDINSALERLDSGEYGICQGCGEDISLKRLAVFPIARYCRDCQEMLDSAISRNDISYDEFEDYRP